MQRTKPCYRKAQGRQPSMTNGKFGRRTLDQLYAISLDWLLVTRLPLAGGKTGCSKLVPAKKAVLLDGSAKLLKYIQDTVTPIFIMNPASY